MEELLDALSVIYWQLVQMEESLMSALDDAVARITADVNTAVATLKAAIAEEASTGADVTAINAAADQLEQAGQAVNNSPTPSNPAPAPAVEPAPAADPAAPLA